MNTMSDQLMCDEKIMEFRAKFYEIFGDVLNLWEMAYNEVLGELQASFEHKISMIEDGNQCPMIVSRVILKRPTWYKVVDYAYFLEDTMSIGEAHFTFLADSTTWSLMLDEYQNIQKNYQCDRVTRTIDEFLWDDYVQVNTHHESFIEY